MVPGMRADLSAPDWREPRSYFLFMRETPRRSDCLGLITKCMRRKLQSRAAEIVLPFLKQPDPSSPPPPANPPGSVATPASLYARISSVFGWNVGAWAAGRSKKAVPRKSEASRALLSYGAHCCRIGPVWDHVSLLCIQCSAPTHARYGVRINARKMTALLGLVPFLAII